MEAKDLMIGDWVQVPSELNRYKRIRSTFDMDSAVLYRPIPLTTEILEMNGFRKDEKREEMYYLNWGIGNNCVSYDKETGIVRIFHVLGHLVFVLPLGYVHELQHAFKLCGITKEIEL